MPISLEHGLKYRCRKVNRGCHTLKMRTNGTRHDIPNTEHNRLAYNPCIIAPCVYMPRQSQETSRQAMEGKDAKSI